ncbi:uncharacterized protein [Ptychodera flava]|uniref:uncharacterized protein n=1 Tax=Ptychodera flava TaxID=63121 RepID=UPI003969E160
MEKKHDLLIQGSPIWRQRSGQTIHPFANLTVADLRRELDARGEETEGLKKPELQVKLSEILHGIQRVPSLLHLSPKANLADINCSRYEILPSEPLHDIKGHIHNVLEELPSDIEDKDEAVSLQTFIQATYMYGDKDEIRGCDARKAILLVSQYLHEKVSGQSSVSSQHSQLIDTLAEISEIAYKHDHERCPRLILRLYNVAFLHGIMCKAIFSNPKKLTKRKMFGRYFHNLTVHQPDQLRVVSLRSTNAENQERVFNRIRRVTKATSSKRPGGIIGNAMVRLDAEEEITRERDSSQITESDISKIAKQLPKRPNTTIPAETISRRPTLLQSHYERIADFLMQGEGVWWQRNDIGVEFFDTQDDFKDSGPPLHHFRSSCLRKEQQYINRCWLDCVNGVRNGAITIPLYQIKLYDSNGEKMAALPQTLKIRGKSIYLNETVVYITL